MYATREILLKLYVEDVRTNLHNKENIEDFDITDAYWIYDRFTWREKLAWIFVRPFRKEKYDSDLHPKWMMPDPKNEIHVDVKAKLKNSIEYFDINLDEPLSI